jgi:RNase H-like domain found in reverse transcriptase/Reverse transcriptase (RNA-dependent DNA polymerase)/Integrase zinc binding domain
LANQEELPSDDDASFKLLEDLPDPNPVNILEPTTKLISNPTVDSIPVPSTTPVSDSIPNNSSTSSVPLISLVSVEAFMRSMQSEEAQCFSILAHEPLKPDPPNKPKFNPDLKDVPEVYHEFADVFSRQKANTLLPHRDCDLKINIDEGVKIPVGPIYLLSKFELKTLWEVIDENLKTGFICPSNSPFRAPVLFIKKKDGSLWLCVDFQQLDAITQKDKYPLPLTSELLDTPSRAKVFSKIDLKHAYHLIWIAAGDEWKTAFRTRYRSFEWLVMPFGLTNAPGGFQRFLNGIFSDLLDVYVIIYLDDILIFSGNKDDHFRHISEVFKWLWKHGLYANGKKCDFQSKSIDYLGHMTGLNGLQIDPAKVKVIQDWPESWKVKDIQSFLGFANFHRRYIHNHSNIIVPLTCLTWKNIPWNFDESCKLAFLTLKQAFISAPVLTHYKPGCLLVIETDASDYALAAILSQVESNGEIHPVTYLSQTFSDTELNYDTHNKELMAIYEEFKAWQHYLKGTKVPIDVITDHKNLEYFCTTWILSRRQARWSTFLSRFNMVIRFRPGRLRTKPDALTCHPDLYPKWEGKPYGTVNPPNCCPVFSSTQLFASLRATAMLLVALCGIITMDIEELQKDILAAYDTDPAVQSFGADSNNSKYSCWSVDDVGFVRIDQQILVPESGDLWLRILQSFYDHPVSRHFGVNKTLSVIQRKYTWPNIREFVVDYVKSCTTCARSKTKQHKLYGLLRQLPVPLRP